MKLNNLDFDRVLPDRVAVHRQYRTDCEEQLYSTKLIGYLICTEGQWLFAASSTALTPTFDKDELQQILEMMT